MTSERLMCVSCIQWGWISTAINHNLWDRSASAKITDQNATTICQIFPVQVAIMIFLIKISSKS